MYWLVKHSLHFLRIRRQEIIFFRNIWRALFSCNTRFEIRLFACLIAGEFWNITWKQLEIRAGCKKSNKLFVKWWASSLRTGFQWNEIFLHQGDGSGVCSIYGGTGIPFPDESFQLKHDGPGLLSMVRQSFSYLTLQLCTWWCTCCI